MLTRTYVMSCSNELLYSKMIGQKLCVLSIHRLGLAVARFGISSSVVLVTFVVRVSCARAAKFFASVACTCEPPRESLTRVVSQFQSPGYLSAEQRRCQN